MGDKLAELQYLSLVNKVTTGAWRGYWASLGGSKAAAATPLPAFVS
jgi:hypothetical protein